MGTSETQNPPYKAWLEATRENHPIHVQGRRLERFAAAVASNEVFRSIYGATNDRNQDQPHDGHDEVDASAPPDSEKEFLRQAARKGCCATLQKLGLFDTHITNVNVIYEGGVTALHIASEYSNVEDVKVLLGKEAKINPDGQGLTPLHVAAASANPNPKIAKVLIKHMMSENVNVNAEIPEQSSEESTIGNTALHFAASNEHVSCEFIQKLKSIDPSKKNRNGNTAFHMAASAGNPDIIVCMLEVFTPAEKGWEMSDIESKGKTTLLEMCVRKGNAKAVALLIKYGADISENVLFHLIDESVRDPTKTDKLVDVYRTITENCVLWYSLAHKSDPSQHCPRRGTAPNAYMQKQRDIMLRLLTGPRKVYRNRNLNVIEYAIWKGDRVFLDVIVNTPNVFKMTEQDSEEKYDITGFYNSSRCCLSIFQAISGTLVQVVPLHGPPPSTAVGGHSTSSRSYIHQIIQNKHLWENTDILQSEPFLTLTQPMCAVVRFINFVMALIQLLHMIVFSIYYMPPFCSSEYQLDTNALAHCNSSLAQEDIAINPSHFYTILNSLLLIWPTAVFLVTLLTLWFRLWKNKHGRIAYFAYGCLTARLMFAPVLWAWHRKIHVSNELSLPLTSAVYLFGWLVALSFFIAVSDNASIFSFLLKKIIVKDIVFSFGIVFVFVLVGFSSAVHTLRESAIIGQSNYSDTLYNMFASALTSGDFISETFDNYSTKSVARFHFFQAMFAIYLCCATIILLNILITMMNNRYKEARRSAKNIWRFQMVASWTWLSLIFGLTSREVLWVFRWYWKCHKLWKHIVHTAYDEVTITIEDRKVSLSLKYAKD